LEFCPTDTKTNKQTHKVITYILVTWAAVGGQAQRGVAPQQEEEPLCRLQRADSVDGGGGAEQHFTCCLTHLETTTTTTKRIVAQTRECFWHASLVFD